LNAVSERAAVSTAGPRPTLGLFTKDALRSVDGHLMAIELGADRVPTGAVMCGVVRAPAQTVADVIADVSGYAGNVPMLDRVRRQGDRVTVTLRFGISLFSVRFEFVADALYDQGGRWLELRWVSGEPRDLVIRFDLAEAESADETLLHVAMRFDVMSLGWLVKLFIKHHPEIRYGVVPGAALTLFDGLARVAERRHQARPR
jgi:hypothetical protein